MLRLGLGLTYVACFVTPWNGIALGPARPGDVFTVLALAVLIAADIGRPFPHLPRWTTYFVAAIVGLTALHAVMPTSPDFLSSRIVVDSRGMLFVETQSNGFVGVKFALGVLALTWMLSLASRDAPGSMFRAAVAFTLGTAASAAVAFGDIVLGTHLSSYSTGTRASGLSIHPNFLAETAALSVPLAIWLAARSRPAGRTLALVLVGVLTLGTYSTGSRGGAVAFAVAVLLTLLLLPRLRRAMPLLLLILGFLVTLAFVAIPSLGTGVLHALRLENSTSAASSDLVRTLASQQATRDFQHSPVTGIGMQVAAEAQNVYLQTLAAGGLILCGAYVLYLVFAATTAWQLRGDHDGITRPLFVGVVVVGLLSFVENALTDRLAYFVPAVVAALWSRTPARDATEAADDEPGAAG